MSELSEQIKEILNYGPICDHCLGRFFGKRTHGLGNDERGRALRIYSCIEEDRPFSPEEETCWICGNLFDTVDTWAEKVKDSLKDLEFKTLLLGCKIPPLISESEEMVWSDLSLKSPEPVKAEFNRETGKRVTSQLGCEVNFKRPDLVVVCNIADGTVDVEVNPVYIYGRYRKNIRGIPQTRWHCRECRGKGCERCNFTGRMYQDSVEELIGRPLIELFEAEDAILHGAGREDIDAVMIGTGRPFVIEIVKPRLRDISFEDMESAIDNYAEKRVEAVFDHVSDRHEVETLKSGKAHKKYSILVEVDGDFSPDDVGSALKSLKGTIIDQRTPDRVSHRRADLVRKRKVIDIECIGVEDGKFRIEVLGDAGLYIKELISGDEGRTEPNFSLNIGADARVTALDVIMVEGVVPESRKFD
ncbi:tRNA pseudouridine(54/55) synthase Pus10 [Methanoplanus endosymbiosus]|uniref:tRNA pseudouridine synthase Pus10 n=1 Tax=Methanoplanus endosymbiosus TaxID=33865 RepID=A0A9E7TKI3_9EURY|nr:tRNA pseudouridine(54/55) synthase Pus10 [Methanoplanus endosymbiosus]UUX92759.1 tRNA pseudouridine(54/55) synthase Pus10 [Methanoplanus endosymbiosus]